MDVDHWVIPPAVAAAVFALIAIEPRVGGGSARGLRVEVAGGVMAGRPLLVGVGLDDPSRDSLMAPAVGRIELAARGVVVDRVELRGEPGTSYALGRMRAPLGGPGGPWELRVEVQGEDQPERATVPLSPAVPVSAPREPAQPPGSIALAVEGGAIVPETPTTVLVRCPGAAEVAMTAEGEGVALDPASAPADACGVAAFRVTVTGLDAPVHVTAAGASTRQRLPVDAGALVVAVEGGAPRVHLVARAAVGAREIYALAGDAAGPTWWGVAPFGGVDVRATMALPPDAAWAVASLSPTWAGAVGQWVAPPDALEPCLATAGPLARRWFALTARRPPLPALRLVYDGAARSRDRLAARERRVRAVALAFLAGAVLLEVALVLGAGFARLPRALQALSRPRWGLLVGGVAVLLMAGFALALNVLMRAAGE